MAEVRELEHRRAQLGLTDVLISGNAITAGKGIDVRGGGLFTSEPVSMARVRIRSNRPDACSGC